MVFKGRCLPAGKGHTHAVGVKGAGGMLAFGHVCGNTALTLQAEFTNSFQRGKVFSWLYPYAASVYAFEGREAKARTLGTHSMTVGMSGLEAMPVQPGACRSGC